MPSPTTKWASTLGLALTLFAAGAQPTQAAVYDSICEDADTICPNSTLKAQYCDTIHNLSQIFVSALYAGSVGSKSGPNLYCWYNAVQSAKAVAANETSATCDAAINACGDSNIHADIDTYEKAIGRACGPMGPSETPFANIMPDGPGKGKESSSFFDAVPNVTGATTGLTKGCLLTHAALAVEGATCTGTDHSGNNCSAPQYNNALHWVRYHGCPSGCTAVFPNANKHCPHAMGLGPCAGVLATDTNDASGVGRAAKGASAKSAAPFLASLVIGTMATWMV